MPIPSRSQYATSGDFLSALNGWMAAGNMARARLQEMFDATLEFVERPAWLNSGVDCMSVSMPARPTDHDLEVVLQMLAEKAHHEEREIIRVCHGFTDGIWSIFAEVRSL